MGQILDIAVYKYTKRGNDLSYEVYFGTHPIVEVNRKVICYYTLPPNYYCLIHRTSVFGFPQWLLPTLLPQTTSNCKRVLLVSVTSSRQSCNLTKGFYNYFLHKMFLSFGTWWFWIDRLKVSFQLQPQHKRDKNLSEQLYLVLGHMKIFCFVSGWRLAFGFDI